MAIKKRNGQKEGPSTDRTFGKKDEETVWGMEALTLKIDPDGPREARRKRYDRGLECETRAISSQI